MATAVTAPASTGVTEAHSPLAIWHLCSLDAPCVAAVWTAFLGRAYGVRLPWTAPVALALAVWLLYAADRLFDAAQGFHLEARHRFHGRYRRAFLLASVCAAPLLLCLLLMLPSPVREGWLLLAVPMAGYVAAVHALRLRVRKEPLVAMFFAAAATLPIFCAGRTHVAQVFPAAVAMGLVCWLNCAAIARWEMMPAASMDTITAAVSEHFPAACAASIVGLLAAWTMLGGAASAGCAAAALGAVCLLLLDGVQTRLDGTTVRALADAALLTPLLLWHLAGAR